MARVTVEDCIAEIPNRFELVLVASRRARKLSTGAAQPCLEWENDKATVLALREIAAGFKFKEDTPEDPNSSAARAILGSHATYAGSIIKV